MDAKEQVEQCTITLRTSMNWETPQFYERNRSIFEAVQFDGEIFPLQFLEPDQEVRVANDDTGAVVVMAVDEYEQWDLQKVMPGDWLVRSPDGLLSTCSTSEFLDRFEEASRK